MKSNKKRRQKRDKKISNTTLENKINNLKKITKEIRNGKNTNTLQEP